MNRFDLATLVSLLTTVFVLAPTSAYANHKHASRRKHAPHVSSERKARGHGKRARLQNASPEVIELFQKPQPTPEPEDFRRHLAPPSIPTAH